MSNTEIVTKIIDAAPSMEPENGPCSCWRAPVALHDFHCCFTYYDAGQNVVTCGHDAEGMRAHLAVTMTVNPAGHPGFTPTRVA